MMPHLFKQPMLLLVISALIVSACSPLPSLRVVPRPTQSEQLTEAEQITGEVLAYLMEVVLGRAGDPEERSAWATRGFNVPLDFNLVSKRMFGPVHLRTELMLIDTNILGLSEVLYHYDRRLNLFKGKRGHDSLYPSAELMAIRLLLARKRLNSGQTYPFPRRPVFFTPGRPMVIHPDNAGIVNRHIRSCF